MEKCKTEHLIIKSVIQQQHIRAQWVSSVTKYIGSEIKTIRVQITNLPAY